MTETLRCDRCGQVGRMAHPYGWLVLEYVRSDLRTWDQEQGPRHFDSWNCLQEYAQKQASTEAVFDEVAP